MNADDNVERARKMQRTEVMIELLECEWECTDVQQEVVTEVHKWNEEEMTKINRLQTIGEAMTIEEARHRGLKVISTRFLVDSRKGKSRLVVQDIRRGPVQMEHFAPTPGLWVLRLVLVISAKLDYGATVVDISSAFLYATLPEQHRVCVTLPAGYGGEKGKCFELMKSLYGLQVAPSLWSAHL
eukprot:2596133-Amphidinium_carterae.1